MQRRPPGWWTTGSARQQIRPGTRCMPDHHLPAVQNQDRLKRYQLGLLPARRAPQRGLTHTWASSRQQATASDAQRVTSSAMPGTSVRGARQRVATTGFIPKTITSRLRARRTQTGSAQCATGTHATLQLESMWTASGAAQGPLTVTGRALSAPTSPRSTASTLSPTRICCWTRAAGARGSATLGTLQQWVAKMSAGLAHSSLLKHARQVCCLDPYCFIDFISLESTFFYQLIE